jgi:TolB protein
MRYGIRLVVILILACGLLVLLAAGVGRILPTEDEIAYSGAVDYRHFEIYRMALARGISVPLTHDLAHASYPDWSPNGQQIVFTSDKSGASTIYIMDVEGRNWRAIPPPIEGDQTDPKWSPDGESIAYVFIQKANHFAYNPQLIVYNLRTQTISYLTNNIDNAQMPTWSPDGAQIAFTSQSENLAVLTIASITLKNGEVQSLTPLPQYEINPTWSPDGDTIAYQDGSPDEIHLLDVNSKQSSVVHIPYIPKSYSVLSGWSPDGRYILYSVLYGDMTQRLFKRAVLSCLQASQSCAPTPFLPVEKPGSYASPRWRPRLP